MSRPSWAVSWRAKAMRNPTDYGWMTPEDTVRFRRDRMGLADPQAHIQALLTLDVGMVSGWQDEAARRLWVPPDSTRLRNPDFERCLHLSIVERSMVTRQLRAVSDAEERAWIEAVFEPGERRLLVRARERSPVLHIRLFLDEHLQPILPSGEVYEREPRGRRVPA